MPDTLTGPWMFGTTLSLMINQIINHSNTDIHCMMSTRTMLTKGLNISLISQAEQCELCIGTISI